MCHLQASLSEWVGLTYWNMKYKRNSSAAKPQNCQNTHRDKSSRVFSSSVIDKSEFSLLILNLLMGHSEACVSKKELIFGILIHVEVNVACWQSHSLCFSFSFSFNWKEMLIPPDSNSCSRYNHHMEIAGLFALATIPIHTVSSQLFTAQLKKYNQRKHSVLFLLQHLGVSQKII